MRSVAVVMGANPVTAEKDMQEVRQFELKLANISTLSGINDVHTYPQYIYTLSLIHI